MISAAQYKFYATFIQENYHGIYMYMYKVQSICKRKIHFDEVCIPASLTTVAIQ